MICMGVMSLESRAIVGSILGVLLVSAMHILLRWRARRRAKASDERPPQKTKLLRPPGHTLTVRIAEYTEQWSEALSESMVAGGVCGLLTFLIYPVTEAVALVPGGWVELRRQLSLPQIFTVLAMAFASFGWLVNRVQTTVRLRRELRNLRFGLRGEQAVAEALSIPEIVAAGYLTFHDIPGDGDWNIDHVVIGPGGILVVETKARSKRKSIRDQPDHEVRFDGEVLVFPWGDDRKAVAQVRRNCEWVNRFVAGFAPKDIQVHPVIVVPGWYVQSTGNHQVKAMNAKYLERYLPSVGRRFTAEQLRPLIRRFDERCRDVEF